MEVQNKDAKDTIQQTVEQRDLPFDLISEMILTRLPIKSLVCFKSVSKLWYSTLSSSRFAFAHLKFHNHSPIQSFIIRCDKKFQIMSYENENGDIDLVNVAVDFYMRKDEMVLVGTCNGLVFLASKFGRSFILWNPITREYRTYSDSDSEISNPFTEQNYVDWGIGYLPAIDDYKIVKLSKEWSSTCYKVHVYSLRSDKWRVIDNNVSAYYDFGLRKPIRLCSPAMLVNETLYWMGFSGFPRTIISFNLESEMLDRFPHFEVSTLLPYVANQDKLLYVVNGCLSTTDTRLTEDNIITILKRPGVIEEIILPRDDVGKMTSFQKFIGFSTSDIFYIEFSVSQDVLGVIDITSRPLKLTPLMTLQVEHQIEFVSYCASLISPNAPCQVRTTFEGGDEVSNI